MLRVSGYEVTFSEQWRNTFGRVDDDVTAPEIAFLTRVLPLPAFSRVLDVPCGFGRHLAGLARAGYDVVGVDNEPAVVDEARATGLDARVGDMRELRGLHGFDAAI